MILGGRLMTLLRGTVVVAVLLGGFLAVRSGSERSRLRAEYRRLSRAVGEVAIDDPSKVWLVALETGEPMHFAWRVYLPANYRLQLRQGGGSSSSWRSDPMEFVGRVRFRESGDGGLQVYRDFGSGSSLTSLADASVAELLRGHWGRLKVEQLGAKGRASLDPAEPATLLRIELPEDLRDQAVATLSRPMQSLVAPQLYVIQLGPAPAP